MLGWSAADLVCLSLDPCRLFSVLNFGMPLLLCSRSGLVIWVMITSMLPRLLVGCWIMSVWLSLCLWLKTEIWLLLPSKKILARGQGTVRVTHDEGHATEVDVLQGKVREEDKFGNAEADAAADLGKRHQPEFVMDTRPVYAH